MFIKICLIVVKLAIIVLVNRAIPINHRRADAFMVQQIGFTYSWQPHPTIKGEYLLQQCDGKQCRHVGGYNVEKGVYRPFENGVYGEPCEPPIDPPAAKTAAKEAPATDVNFGVNTEALNRYKGPMNIVNGKSVSRQEAFARLSSLSDDSLKPFLTCIGTEEACAKIKSDLKSNAALAGVKDKWRFKDYRPSDIMIADYGFDTTGAPSIYLQDVNGKVLARASNYEGPEKLAVVAEQALLPPAPPNTVDMTKLIQQLKGVPGWAYAVLAAIAVLLFTKKQQQ